MVIIWSLGQEDCFSEKTGMFIVDTAYARVRVGISKMRPCSGPCAICDVVMKYRFHGYPGGINTTLISVLESGVACSYFPHRTYQYSAPEWQEKDSVQCAFPIRNEVLDTAHVLIKITGHCYKVLGDGDSMHNHDYVDIKFEDTLVVRTERIE